MADLNGNHWSEYSAKLLLHLNMLVIRVGKLLAYLQEIPKMDNNNGKIVIMAFP